MDDRAQLMLIGAVVIAVAMLALVTVLNSTIYAQNVAPGNTLDETRETNEQLQVVQRDVTRITERHQEKYGYVDEARLNESLRAYGSHLTEQTAWRSPAHADVELNRTTNDTVLGHDDEVQFRSKTGDRDWTLVENASLTGSTPFEMTVSGLDSGVPLKVFVNSTTGGDSWSLEFLRVPSDDVETTIRYENRPADTDRYDGPTIAVNVSGGTINGTDEFDFAPDVGGPYDISVKNGQHVGNGSYTVTVDEHSVVNATAFHDDRTDGNPYVSRAVESATVDVRYGTGSVSMDTQVEVTAE